MRSNLHQIKRPAKEIGGVFSCLLGSMTLVVQQPVKPKARKNPNRGNKTAVRLSTLYAWFLKIIFAWLNFLALLGAWQ